MATYAATLSIASNDAASPRLLGVVGEDAPPGWNPDIGGLVLAILPDGNDGLFIGGSALTFDGEPVPGAGNLCHVDGSANLDLGFVCLYAHTVYGIFQRVDSNLVVWNGEAGTPADERLALVNPLDGSDANSAWSTPSIAGQLFAVELMPGLDESGDRSLIVAGNFTGRLTWYFGNGLVNGGFDAGVDAGIDITAIRAKRGTGSSRFFVGGTPNGGNVGGALFHGVTELIDTGAAETAFNPTGEYTAVVALGYVAYANRSTDPIYAAGTNGDPGYVQKWLTGTVAPDSSFDGVQTVPWPPVIHYLDPMTGLVYLDWPDLGVLVAGQFTSISGHSAGGGDETDVPYTAVAFLDPSSGLPMTGVYCAQPVLAAGTPEVRCTALAFDVGQDAYVIFMGGAFTSFNSLSGTSVRHSVVKMRLVLGVDTVSLVPV